MVSPIRLDKDNVTVRALESLLTHCESDKNLKNDKNVHMILYMGKKMGIQKDYVPRIIPLKSCKLNKPKELRILLITKDPSSTYRAALAADSATSDLFKEIISIKNLKRRFRGSKMIHIYKEFDLIVADFRVHHLLVDVLGNKRLPFVIRFSRKSLVKGQKMPDECDPSYVRAQLRNICKNTWYVPNNDNCLSVNIGIVGKTTVPEMIQNAHDVIEFLTDKTKRPQGGVIKGGITSIFVKTSNSPSLSIYEKPQETTEPCDDPLRL
ncbi:hypothetical protein HG537_0A08260 [Torulaspora globosa]|uniref:Ribosomal protein L1 n=1 Tax=Torulaspora globosa TaxID=48254 RepID=A0A7H9HMS5_9SACH|nr:hypothetical protein HG537_0A08260 [Torulaspora sp. CBS 2947]